MRNWLADPINNPQSPLVRRLICPFDTGTQDEFLIRERGDANGGKWVQVGRQGNPLFCEALIGIEDKEDLIADIEQALSLL